MQLSLRSRVQQLVVRDAAPEKEGQTRRQLDVVDPERASGRDVGRFALDAEEELRADEQPLECAFDSGVEAALAASFLIERQQILDVRLGRRPPICAAGQREQNLFRAPIVLRRT